MWSQYAINGSCVSQIHIVMTSSQNSFQYQWIHIYLWWFPAHSSWEWVCKASDPHLGAYIFHPCFDATWVYHLPGPNLGMCTKTWAAWLEHHHPSCRTELLCFGMSNQMVHSLQHVCLNEGFKISYFLYHMQDNRHIVQIHIWFYEKSYGGKILFMQLHVPTAECGIIVIMRVSHHQETHKHLFENAFCHEQRQKTKHILTFVVFITIIKLHVHNWRQGFSKNKVSR